MDSDWFGGVTASTNSWDQWEEDAMWGGETERLSLRSLDPTFIADLTALKHHCYDITVLQIPLDSERAQSMAPLQDYINLLSAVHMILLKAPYDTEQQTSLPASVQTKMAPLLEWIRHFCETNRDPVDRLPYQSHLTSNLKEAPYDQTESKIME
jgi:hypothetical protein